MTAREIMHRNVVTVNPDMTLKELAKLFIDKHISGAPVVEKDGRLLGVVSQTDIVRHEREAGQPEAPAFYRDPEQAYRPNGIHVESPDYTRVRDVMTPAVFSAEESAPAAEVARLMLKKRIHRVVITAGSGVDKRLSGIVTTMDLLRAFLEAVEGRKEKPAEG